MKHLDKLFHASLCHAILTIVSAIISLPVGIAVACILAIGKEVYDWFDYGKELGFRQFAKLATGDLVADIIGIGVAIWTVRLLLR